MTLKQLLALLVGSENLFFAALPEGGHATLAEPLVLDGAVVLPALLGAVSPSDRVLSDLRGLAAEHGALPVRVWLPEVWHRAVALDATGALVVELAEDGPAVPHEEEIVGRVELIRIAEREIAEAHPNMEEPI